MDLIEIIKYPSFCSPFCYFSLLDSHLEPTLLTRSHAVYYYLLRELQVREENREKLMKERELAMKPEDERSDWEKKALKKRNKAGKDAGFSYRNILAWKSEHVRRVMAILRDQGKVDER